MKVISLNIDSMPMPLTQLRRVISLKLLLFCLGAIVLALAASNILELCIEGTFNYKHLVISSSIGAILGSTAVFLLSRLYGTQEHIPFFEVFPPSKVQGKILIRAFVVAALLSVVSEFLLHDIRNIVKEPGWLFEVLVAVFTLVGLWLAYSAILESRRVISSFDELYDRLLVIAKETKENPQMGKLRMLAYTPAIGFLALPRDRWTDLKTFLGFLADNKALEIICLDEEDLKYWHNQYIGRQTRRKPIGQTGGSLGIADTMHATHESELLVREITGGNSQSRKKTEMLPGFYLVFNKVKAIIVAPLFIPFPVGGLTSSQQKLQNRVEMLGFETSDKRIIADVADFFEEYRDTVQSKPSHFDSQIGNTDEISTLLTKQVEKIKSGSLKDKPLLRYRLSVFEAEPWERDIWQVILYYLQTYNKVDRTIYDSLLKATQFDHIDGTSQTIYVRAQRECVDSLREKCKKVVDQAANELHLYMRVEFFAPQDK